VMAMAFEPMDEVDELDEWLKEVRHELVMTITDRDDGALQKQVLVLPACESTECALRHRHGRE
jgi:hypothetical protein